MENGMEWGCVTNDTGCVANDTPSVTSFRLDALGTSYESGGRDVSANTGPGPDADAVFYVKLSDMRAIFQFQRPTTGTGGSADVSLNTAVFDPSSNIRYYVFRKRWPTSLKLNPSHAMLDRSESSGMLTGGGGGGGGGGGTGSYSSDKSLVKHDFIRYIALQLFQSVHGVDLFQNEEDIRENLAYNGEVARVGIMSVLDTVSTMSADITMAIDGSGNRYATNTDMTTTNISRELMCQIATNAPERFSNGGNGGLESVPFIENDTLNIRVVIQTSPNQHALTNVAAIPARIYNIKLVIKSAMNGSSNNTAVSDSRIFPNGYPYSSNIYDISASNVSVAAAVYADGSPPVPIPSIRYGYQGWYYTNSDAWVNTSPAVRNKINWYLLPNSGGATVGDVRYIRLILRVFNRVSVPFLTVYTQATGSGDAGGWYKSKRTYVISDTVSELTDHTSYCFYINMNGYSVTPFVMGHTNLSLTSSTVNGSAVGSFASTETLFAYSIGTDSGSARGNVEFILSNVIVGEMDGAGGGGGGVVIEKEYGFIP